MRRVLSIQRSNAEPSHCEVTALTSVPLLTLISTIFHLHHGYSGDYVGKCSVFCKVCGIVLGSTSTLNEHLGMLSELGSLHLIISLKHMGNMLRALCNRL